MDRLSLRIGDLEVRSCDRSLGTGGQHDRLCIVKHYDSERPAGEYCYVVAWWQPHKEGYDLRFLSDRPFKVNRQTFWDLAVFGQQFLAKHFAAGGGEAGAAGRIET